MYPKKFEDLIMAFRKLPGVGQKTAERYAYALLEWNEEEFNDFDQSIHHMKGGLNYCEVCGNMSEGKRCEYCEDQNRNHHMICIVKSTKDIEAIEAMDSYHGVYHVLKGLINTQKGILPDDLNLQSLIDRVEGNQDIEEVIIALDSTIDGETTALYIEKLLENKVKVTRLAYGIPIGGHLDYTDSLTLLKAFEGRK